MKNKNKEKFIIFFMDEEDIENICINNFRHGYYETLKAIENEEYNIYTTQLSLLETSLFKKGYKVYIREKEKDIFEIKLGKNERTDKKIRKWHNLEKLLLMGEFRRYNETLKQ